MEKYIKSISPNVKNTIINIWVPQPNMTDNNIPFFGGRKTSPWTNFQPNSSWASSYKRCDKLYYFRLSVIMNAMIGPYGGLYFT